MVYRIYVEKKPGCDGEARQLQNELNSLLGIKELTGLRLLNRYDVEGISEALFDQCVSTVFSEPPVDNTYVTLPRGEEIAFAVEYLPGQFDQRADSAAECIQLISQGERPLVRSARVYLLEGPLSEEQIAEIKKYVINPVEAREASLEERETLKMEYAVPTAVATLTGFNELDEAGLAAFIQEKGLAMDLGDIKFCQEYFRSEQRDPTITEIKMIDTYWSDHCRHTTFGTILDDVQIDEEVVQAAFDRYMALREDLGRTQKPRCLMDIATIGAKELKKQGILKNLDESEEINACTVKIKCDVNGKDEDWLFLFKNETHNHPTEIEPFGGAATCIGGAIRDPLSGRSYVYQAMRVTGAGDPLAPVSETLPGKLPQRKLVTTAAAGYSSYGNQIGLATGQVDELYHPGYLAKRLEIGAVVGATPASHVRRECPAPGDVIVLLGGRTGRDGIGGATGSSKAHKMESLESCGAEVQKGNAPIERKLQRLFRREDACRMIKRCNDFGAGGVSVAIGELADGLYIDLNKVTKKYEGLDGTELAISESQERMAVALAPEDVDKFIALANAENLEATPVATVTEEKRLNMVWNGVSIVNISREFLNSNGAEKHQKVHVEKATVWQPQWAGATFGEQMKSMVGDLNVCSKKGLSERFDSTIGAGTVLMPFGGAYQLTPQMAMVAKLPVDGETTTCSGMAWGYNPYLMSADQYRGAKLAVIESVTKLVSAGFRYEDAYLTFQEYFERLGTQPERWGKPLAALLGALDAQMGLGIGAIGGKDSMSGSFEKLDVPPTLVSFATAIGKTSRVISTEFKKSNSSVVLLRPVYEADGISPTFSSLKANYQIAEQMIASGQILSAASVGFGGIAEALFKMGLGNRIGFKLLADLSPEDLFKPMYGSLVLEYATGAPAGMLLGETTREYTFTACGETLDSAQLQEIWESKLEPVYPYRKAGEAVEKISGSLTAPAAPKIGVAKPKVIIPVFPGTNCEYDTARAFARAGADPEILVIRNLTPADVTASCEALVKAIDASQIVMLPGGFSGGDEPDGSAKFIASFFRSPAVTEAVRRLLNQRDGLMLGICNGFQALIKLGLVPYGDIRPITESDPTLTFNTIGRHQSMLVRTRIASKGSPWLTHCDLGDEHTVAISHGEGRFVAPQKVLDQLIANGQIATQYVDLDGQPTMDLRYNPNGSVLAIEGITSPDGRVFGKMGHSERSGDRLYKNVTGDKYQPIFEGGVDYFKI
ncbi:phosphoribosylformylglycinamidine synthase [Faecalibacterium gallinarum]|uniref:Phosphoribosylformylglycinamidine synthase n=1 Tax=Faecalibacterium gallinarum TaxID=2903556 RepID=A0AA37IWA8_9FIRM|nr:phosphoribosylformylglycinamidine synthase [Faecalibacterium gallinarum]GJN63667.1 phosphoribosylformylglycinamidine synthase [Faecalibacterium gallinarum]